MMVFPTLASLWQLRSCEALDRLWEGPGSCPRRQWGLRQSGNRGKDGPSVSEKESSSCLFSVSGEG